MAQLLGYSEFLDRVHTELAALPGDRVLAVAVVGLDFISKVDGSFGYAAGDSLLQMLAGRLRDALPQRDVVGEVSRSEIACLLPALPSTGHISLALSRILRTLREPIVVAGHEVFPTPLVGISSRRAPGDADELLREANLAMHTARRHDDGYAYFDPGDSQAEQLNYELHSDLHRAIEENELAVFHQPLMDLRNGRVAGSEALLRWIRPAGKPVSPDRVVMVAEHTGLIRPLTTWICSAALRHCGALQAEGLDVGVSVNVSVKNLAEPELPELIARALRMWNVPSHRLTLELTETAMMDDTPGSMEALHRLKDQGLMLAMDDFGTGFSSMARLKSLPLDELKIDIRFVRDMMNSPRDDKIVHSMIEMAHRLDMMVVAEGVESERTAQRLGELGCEIIQGYFVSKALPLDQYREFLRARAEPSASRIGR